MLHLINQYLNSNGYPARIYTNKGTDYINITNGRTTYTYASIYFTGQALDTYTLYSWYLNITTHTIDLQDPNSLPYLLQQLEQLKEYPLGLDK